MNLLPFCLCRFCPSVFLYLASVIPGIWLLHMDMYQTRKKLWSSQPGVNCEEVVIVNVTALKEVKGVSNF